MINEAKDIVVSVIMVTYEHEEYIEQAINGILMQKCNFQYELIIADDCSPDNTNKVVQNIINNRIEEANKIKYVKHATNKGMNANFLWALQQVRGKYIAMCEGDDYWTDPLKLQKQVDFLKANQQYDLCSHRFKIYDEENNKWQDDKPQPEMDEDIAGVEFDFEINTKVWHSQTMTLLFRTEKLRSFQIEKYDKFCDFHLCYLLTKEKKGFCMNLDAAVYRLHKGGVFSKQSLEWRTHMGYNTTKDLFRFNQEDAALKRIFFENKKAYFENYLRLSVYKKNYSKKLLVDILRYLKEEYSYTGIKGILYSLKKLTLSFLKSVKLK